MDSKEPQFTPSPNDSNLMLGGRISRDEEKKYLFRLRIISTSMGVLSLGIAVICLIYWFSTSGWYIFSIGCISILGAIGGVLCTYFTQKTEEALFEIRNIISDKPQVMAQDLLMFSSYCLMVTQATYLVLGTLGVLYPWAIMVKPINMQFQNDSKNFAFVLGLSCYIYCLFSSAFYYVLCILSTEYEQTKHVVQITCMNLLSIALVAFIFGTYVIRYGDQEESLSVAWYKFACVIVLLFIIPSAFAGFYVSYIEDERSLLKYKQSLIVTFSITAAAAILMYYNINPFEERDQYQFGESCLDSLNSVHQDYFEKFGCQKYTSTFASENDAQCPKPGVAFIWENQNETSFGCLNPDCCEYTITQPQRSAQYTIVSLTAAAQLMTMLYMSVWYLVQKIERYGVTRYYGTDQKILIAMLCLTAVSIGICMAQGRPESIILNEALTVGVQVLGVGDVNPILYKGGYCLSLQNLDIDFDGCNACEYIVDIEANDGDQIYVNYIGEKIQNVNGVILKGSKLDDIKTAITDGVVCPVGFNIPNIKVKINYDDGKESQVHSSQFRFNIEASTQILKGSIVGAIQGAQISFDALEDQIQSDEYGEFQVEITEPLYHIPYKLTMDIQKSGYDSLQYQQTIGGIPFNFTQTPAIPLRQISEFSQISGTTFDSFLNKALGGVQLSLYKGYMVDKPNRLVDQVFSNSQGHFEFSNLNSGWYTLVAESQGYFTDFQPVYTGDILTLSLSPNDLTPDMFRFVLSWTSDNDLDIHASFRPFQNTTCEIGYSYRNCGGAYMHN